MLHRIGATWAAATAAAYVCIHPNIQTPKDVNAADDDVRADAHIDYYDYTICTMHG